MSNAGRKILAGLKDALDGNFAAVTIEGQRWVRLEPGFVVVPRAPTEEMMVVGRDRPFAEADRNTIYCWERMIGAASRGPQEIAND